MANNPNFTDQGWVPGITPPTWASMPDLSQPQPGIGQTSQQQNQTPQQPQQQTIQNQNGQNNQNGQIPAPNPFTSGQTLSTSGMGKITGDGQQMLQNMLAQLRDMGAQGNFAAAGMQDPYGHIISTIEGAIGNASTTNSDGNNVAASQNNPVSALPTDQIAQPWSVGFEPVNYDPYGSNYMNTSGRGLYG